MTFAIIVHGGTDAVPAGETNEGQKAEHDK
jgi:hypothetical protein